MVHLDARKIGFSFLVVLVLAVMVAACQTPGGDPYQAGQAFRDQVDRFLQESGEFVAGFCSTSLLPVVIAGLAAYAVGKKAH
jgi:hypothetical protein